MIEIHKKIFDLHREGSIIDFTDDFINISKTMDNCSLLEEINVKYEVIQNKYLQISRHICPIKIFNNVFDFLKFKNIDCISNVLILDYKQKPISHIGKVTYENFIETNSLFLFSNSETYYKFIKYLQSIDNEDENAFHFIDYFNSSHRKIVLTSLSEKGRVIIKYSEDIPLFDTSIDLSNNLVHFKNCVEEKENHFQKFLKNSLIDYASRYNPEERLERVFENLKQIIHSARINFEVYVNNISIDKIRKGYDEYKIKYFSELSDILSKITHKIIGLPIAISAALLALNSIKENDLFLIFLLFAIIVTTFYLGLLLKIEFKDLNYIKKVFNDDYRTLTNNDFFIKNKEELESFDTIKTKILERIKHLKLISESYYWVLCSSNIAINGLILHKIGLNDIMILILSLIQIFIVALYRNFITSKKNGSA